ncbi:MAG: energy transducer TonB [Caulobacter sp.]|nr:energy transducer TonB [Caulobacter sp.]
MLLAAAAAAVLLAGEAPPPTAAPPVRTRPDWVRVPTLDEIADFYPRAARARGIEGRAVLDCRVAITGRLKDCRIHQEAPVAMGFGEAALMLAPLIEMRPGTVNGEPVVDELVRAPIAFKLPGGPLPGLDETLRCHGLLSAHLRLSPDDRRLEAAAGLAGLRAESLMMEAEVDADERARRLTAARSEAPTPRRAGATLDRCFERFLD